MQRGLSFFFILLFFSMIFTACSQATKYPTVPTLSVSSTDILPTFDVLTTEVVQASTDIPTPTIVTNAYDDCGPGKLLEMPYFFKDDNGTISPTQIVRFQTTIDEVRRYVSVISCLVFDEGWQSNPDEVEGGYENEIIFFDKYGRAHPYRIIIGGHYISPYDPSHKDIIGSINGVDEKYYIVDDWINITREYFQSIGVRQIGVDVYLDDTNGNLSSVLKQVYQFRETNILIAEALRSGDGYPEQVPEGFFLFATKSWLIPSN